VPDVNEFGTFYLLARILLAVLTSFVAVATFQYVWRASQAGRRWRTGFALAALLCFAAGLSVVDAIDNVVVRFLEPIPGGSWLWLFGFDLLLPIWALLLLRAWRARDNAEIELIDKAFVDSLTGVLNRRGFLDKAVPTIALARRAGQAVSVAMLDLDRFKEINDTHGHAAGDGALKALGRALTAELRTGDVLGRVGGDEFVVLLPGCTPEAALPVATRWRERLQRERPGPRLSLGSLRISVGVAQLVAAGDPAEALTQGCAVADAALYRAKRRGRDRIEIAGPDDDVVAAEITKS
jgi:diguanylate cyclase (GGDEF)-like protein